MTTQLVPITPELFRLDVSPASIVGNFSEIQALVEATLESRKTLVTPETIKGGKNLCADFRKTSKALMDAWKDKRSNAMTDIIKADADVKAICALLDNGANEIAEQVKAIEDETKKVCAEQLSAYLFGAWEGLQVDHDFRKALFDDLVKLGSLNPKGELTKAAKETIETRAKADKAWQDKIAHRLIALENECLKAGINQPFTSTNVEPFLFTEDDADYARRLGFLVDAEVKRKEEAERIMREKLEKEAAEKERRAVAAALAEQQAEANRIATQEAQRQHEETMRMVSAEQSVTKSASMYGLHKKPESDPEKVTESLKLEDGKVAWKVRVLLEYRFQTDPHITEVAIRKAYANKLTSCGIEEKNILNIMVLTNS